MLYVDCISIKLGEKRAYSCKMKCRKDKPETNGIGYLRGKDGNEWKKIGKTMELL